MKYIVIEKSVGPLTREFPIVFPNELSHIDVAEALLKKCSELNGGTIVGAGELSCMDIDPNCYGRSATLNVNSWEELDDRSFAMRDYNWGIVS